MKENMKIGAEHIEIKRINIAEMAVESEQNKNNLEEKQCSRNEAAMEDGVKKVDIKKADMREALDLAMNMGRVLLKNGAEIFRVEETIEHVCKRFEIVDVDPFVMSNGIFMTARVEEEEVYAKVKHIPISGFHLGIVTEVNDLSREIASGSIEIGRAHV